MAFSVTTPSFRLSLVSKTHAYSANVGREDPLASHAMAIIPTMRINLVTPFAEKDAVKALGARWDPAKKVWYITDVADLTPFLRWIPKLEAACEPSGGAAKSAAKTPAKQSPGVSTKSTVVVPHCGCQVLPWVDCEHTGS
jgi:hypothetical protein